MGRRRRHTSVSMLSVMSSVSMLSVMSSVSMLSVMSGVSEHCVSVLSTS
jgi:ABC-type lipoprotein release transport system permease subunit